MYVGTLNQSLTFYLGGNAGFNHDFGSLLRFWGPELF